jgi:glycosyltransferase involved in cell wall biosynthesis
VSKFVCISDFIQERLLAVKDVSSKVCLIYNYPPERKVAERINNLIPKADTDLFTVIYMGQISADKGVNLLVQAAERFLQQYPHSRFFLAGQIEHSSLAEELILIVEEKGLLDKISFIGMVEDIPGLLGACHVHICPSVCNEALSNVVGEAKMAARPSIVFPSGGLPELVRHKKNGYICRGKSVDDILKALEYYYLLPDWGKEQGRAARESMQEIGMTKEAFLDAWRNVYGIS